MSGHAWLKALDYVGRIIEMGPNSKGDDGNWDPGMRALVLWITEDEPDVWIAKVDFRPFMATNTPLMVPDFYDGQNKPVLTALEAKSWMPIDSWYLPAPGPDWDQRLSPGPRWRTVARGVHLDHKDRRHASVFDGMVRYHRWKEASEAELDAVRALADDAGFLGGQPSLPISA